MVGRDLPNQCPDGEDHQGRRGGRESVTFGSNALWWRLTVKIQIIKVLVWEQENDLLAIHCILRGQIWLRLGQERVMFINQSHRVPIRSPRKSPWIPCRLLCGKRKRRWCNQHFVESDEHRKRGKRRLISIRRNWMHWRRGEKECRLLRLQRGREVVRVLGVGVKRDAAVGRLQSPLLHQSLPSKVKVDQAAAARRDANRSPELATTFHLNLSHPALQACSSKAPTA